MILKFNLDNQDFIQDLNVLSPLSNFLSHLKKEGFALNPSSSKLVIFNEELVSSRHIPLICIQESHILTKEGIQNTDEYKIISRIMYQQQASFCPNCYTSRILLLYYLLKFPPLKVEEEILKFYHSESCYCLSFSFLKELFHNILREWENFEK